jgi:alpha-D-xyloside xylohydrolase
MKFFDGNWLVKEGVTPHFAAEAYDAVVDGGRVALYCPDRPIGDRGDTVDGGLLTIRLSSPFEDVLCVRISHFEGGPERGPRFALRAEGSAAGISSGEGAIAIKAGSLVARVRRKSPFLIEYLGVDQDGAERRLTSTGERRAAWLAVEGQGSFVAEQLSLGVGELIYGLGERFTPFVKNGQSVDMWNEDGGTSSEQSYKSIPFYLSSAGYGLLVNHPGRVSFEVGSERVARVQFSVPGEELEYFLIYGPGPKEVLAKYARLAGRPALPPAWSFGLWLTTSFTTAYDEKTVLGFIGGMAARDLPLRVFHFDCFWMREYRLCDLEWDAAVFPEPEAMLARIKRMGVKVCVWINPYIAQRSAMFAEGKERGFLLEKASGGVWQWDRWQAGMAIVDFTNPGAREWYAGKLGRLVDMGIDCFKTDFGERIPTDVRYFDGSDPVRMHNYYTLLYNELVFEVLEEKLGKGAAVVFARSATVGGQKYPVHWGGDSSASFESMAESLRGGLSLGLSGFGFWSHDIGGFEDKASPAVYKRWVAFGLLSSHSRLHGSKAYKVPWLYDAESVEVLRFFTKLKCRLMPYIFATAVEASSAGTPVMRPMMLEFPGDEACAYLDRQYMLGPDLLVAPVFDDGGEVSYYLPDGLWTRLLPTAASPEPATPSEAAASVEGGRWLRERHGYLSLPLLVRPNSIIPLGAVDDLPDYDYAEGASFHVFEPSEGSEAVASLTDLEGRRVMTCRALLRGKRLSVKIEDGKGRYRVHVRMARAATRDELERGFELEAGGAMEIDVG